MSIRNDYGMLKSDKRYRTSEQRKSEAWMFCLSMILVPGLLYLSLKQPTSLLVFLPFFALQLLILKQTPVQFLRSVSTCVVNGYQSVASFLRAAFYSST